MTTTDRRGLDRAVSTASLTDWICRDGARPTPLTEDELAAVRSHMDLYDSSNLIPRLLATIEEPKSEPGQNHQPLLVEHEVVQPPPVAGHMGDGAHEREPE
jgi:hypothetical protein